MKRIIVLGIALLLAGVGSANAQSLLELLQASQATGQTQTENAAVQKINLDVLKGVWNYTGAAVEFTGTDMISMLGSSVATPHIKQGLESFYARLGVVAGSCTLDFGERNTFTGRTADHSVAGPYQFDAQTQKVAVSYNDPQLGGQKTLDGKLSFNGEKLSLTFEAAKIVSIIREQTKDMELEQNVKDLLDLISQYPGLYLGFALEK
jgi:hypothetical protein